jgi:hypothetical protein
MRRVYVTLAGLCCASIFAIFAIVPAREANLAYVRSAAAVKAMHELNEPGIAFRIEAEPAGRRGVSLISGYTQETFETQIQGLRANKKTTFSFSGLAKSYCAEYQPGCLEIHHGPFSKVVSVEVPM